MATYNLKGEGGPLTAPDDLAPIRVADKYLTWIKAEFAPLTMITPDSTLQQILENAIRYFNTHSAYKVSGVYDVSSKYSTQLDPSFKAVVDVIPTTSTTWIWNDLPLWPMLNLMVMDTNVTDLILMSESYRNYRIYVGADFRWNFIPSPDPRVGGILQAINIPTASHALYVIGTKRITADEDIKEEFINDWLLRYYKALVKVTEGNSLRKAGIINVATDGQQYVDEGIKEQEELRKELNDNGKWMIFAKRG